ncbi:MAG: hypothetical protein COV48_04925 [Elusimicrobia bacterium CG11_big_fil_rev_8_21_14_0_20_64_6]|nr:MAG: hypothetical protein COV48_04925 [Elusimicrobia bacterium CG11_big_fil_rev_8_21_14_0_20_64_6]
MNRPAFRERYPALSATIGGEFGDSAADDDEAIAHNFAAEFPPEERARYLGALLAEAHLLMDNIDEHWEAMAKEANRRLYTRDAARGWLVRITIAWQEELTRLRDGGSQQPS